MGLKPDYGLRLMREGWSPDADQYFYAFRLFSLSVIDKGQYSTMVEKPYSGEMHALSLDFNHTQLEQILANANHDIAASLRTELARDPSSPRSIDFNGYVEFGVRARLGQLQTAAKEQFVPLVAQEIF
jgi:hypothetical protein